MIERVARDVSFPIDRLEKMMEMHERVTLRNAEASWNEAMAAAQSEISVVGFDSNNPQTRSRYASYASMDAVVRPIYTKYGFALTFGTDSAQRVDDVTITCTVSKGGYSKHYSISMPADGKGARGNEVMTRTHATGSAVTYGRRYLLSMIFNIACGEVDDDGNLAGKYQTARARNSDIAKLPPDKRGAATEYAHEVDAERIGQGMINAARAVPRPATETETDGARERFWNKNRKTPAVIPPHDEDGVIIEQPTDRSAALQYICVTRDVIRTAHDPDKLTSWLNSPEQKQERQKAKLTDEELISLRDFAAARKAQLKAANGNGVPSHEDTEAFYRYVTAKMVAAKDKDELANVYAAIVEPVESKMFPPDVTALTDAYARRERQLKDE
jgi:hypothetical protein